MKKRFVYSSKGHYTYKEIDSEANRLLSKMSVEEKMNFIKRHHRIKK